MVICENCGKTVPDGANCCPYCGSGGCFDIIMRIGTIIVIAFVIWVIYVASQAAK